MDQINFQILPRESSPRARSKFVLSQIGLLIRTYSLYTPEVSDLYAQHIREILSDARKTKSDRFVREVERNIINILSHIANSVPNIFQAKFQSIIFHHDNAMEFMNGGLGAGYDDFFNGKTNTLAILNRANLGRYLHTRLANTTCKKDFFEYLEDLIYAWQIYPNIISRYIDEQYGLFPVNVYMSNDNTEHASAYSKVPKGKEEEFIKRLNILSFFTSKFNGLPDSENKALGVHLGINDKERYLVNSLILLVDPDGITKVHEVRNRKHDISPYTISDPLPDDRVYH